MKNLVDGLKKNWTGRDKWGNLKADSSIMQSEKKEWRKMNRAYKPLSEHSHQQAQQCVYNRNTRKKEER
jgi:hypothetical protein